MRNKKVDALAYPFTYQSLPFIRNADRSIYNIKILATCEGSCLAGKDAGFSENHPEIGIGVQVFDDAMLKSVDCLLILPFPQEMIHVDWISVVLKALKLGKQVVVCCDINREDQKTLDELKEQYDEFLVICGARFEKIVQEINSERKLHETRATIIGIGGTIEQADQTDVLLLTTYLLRQQGYRVSFLGEEPFCELLDGYSFKSILQSSLSYEQRIRWINDSVYKIEKIEDPDFIVVQIPGVLMRFNDTLIGDAGSSTYIFSEALNIDHYVCCAMYGIYDQKSFKDLSLQVENKFGFRITCAHISNKMVDVINSIELMKMKYIRVPLKQVDEYLQTQIPYCSSSFDVPVYNLLNPVSHADYLKTLLS